MFPQFSECFHCAFIICGERETNVFHFSGIFSAFNFWLRDGIIRFRNRQYQYCRGWNTNCIMAQRGKPGGFHQTLKSIKIYVWLNWKLIHCHSSTVPDMYLEL